jgi:hypothetical protein
MSSGWLNILSQVSTTRAGGGVISISMVHVFADSSHTQGVHIKNPGNRSDEHRKYKIGVWVTTSLSRVDPGAPDRLSNPKIRIVGMLTEEYF